MTPLKLLFVGESWYGSCARSLKEALNRHPKVILDEVSEDLYFPKSSNRWIRAINRMLQREYRAELYRNILRRVDTFRPDVVIAYKGFSITSDFISKLKASGCQTVCIYPDCSPHAYGEGHKSAIGSYDLVISTKPFHPALWKDIYHYNNACRFVPQGYDPELHLVNDPPSNIQFDVGMVATYRKEYGDLIEGLAERFSGSDLKFLIGGNGWDAFRNKYMLNWTFKGELHGRSYTEWLRRSKICIAPLSREVVINSVRQPGDVETTRTYELSAAHCFFIHRRTDYVCSLYDQEKEVPLFDTIEELADKIRYFLVRPDERRRIALAAHHRAVPAYSLDRRAEDIVGILRNLLHH